VKTGVLAVALYGVSLRPMTTDALVIKWLPAA
jgi:hypothetical protein